MFVYAYSGLLPLYFGWDEYRYNMGVQDRALIFQVLIFSIISIVGLLAGFRYGVCYELSMFDILNRKKLAIKQRPLIVMEYTIIDEVYMGLGYSKEAFETMQDLKQKCLKYNGSFSLLWHNSHFKTEDDEKMFEEIVRCQY